MESCYYMKGTLEKVQCLTLQLGKPLGKLYPSYGKVPPGPAETAGVAPAKRK